MWRRLKYLSFASSPGTFFFLKATSSPFPLLSLYIYAAISLFYAFRFVVIFMDSFMICKSCLGWEESVLAQITCFWVTLWIAALTVWKHSFFCLPLKYAIPPASPSSVATTNLVKSLKYTASMTSVCANTEMLTSGATVVTFSIVFPWLPSLEAPSWQCMVDCRPWWAVWIR